MPVFKVLYARYGKCEVEAANEDEAKQAVADMAANGDACVSFGKITMHTVDEMISSIDEFVNKCRAASCDEIYYLFDEQLADSVRDELYQMSFEIDPFAPEPVRCVIHALGVQHNVQSMINY